jgi:hypothetical protein
LDIGGAIDVGMIYRRPVREDSCIPDIINDFQLNTSITSHIRRKWSSLDLRLISIKYPNIN